MKDYFPYFDILEEIKSRIKEQYQSQAKFARMMHVSREWLNKMLNYSGSMDYEVMFDICKKLGIKGITF